MPWPNSLNKLRLPRARSYRLSDSLYLVRWRGGDYIVQGPAPVWKVRRRGTPGILATVTEKEGLGKEEAIRWIECNV